MALNPPSPRSATDTSPTFELKAAGFTLPVMRLLAAEMELVAEQLGAKVEQAPDFFRNTPVVIDLTAFPVGAGEVEFPLLVGLLRGYGMIPFGVRGGTKAQTRAAEAMELAILGDTFTRSSKPAAAEPAPAATPEVEVNAAPGFRLISGPIRSGTRVHAPSGDLTVLGPVNPGAELSADGNIHVYGRLGGRALAGRGGNTDARIFCQDLQAELVSVAGHYKPSESIPAELRAVPVQIFLEQKVLRIERL